MNEWLRQNSWPLIIASLGVVMTWGLYGYRLTEAENDIKIQAASIRELEINNNKTGVLLEGIRKDIEYIKIQVSKIAN